MFPYVSGKVFIKTNSENKNESLKKKSSETFSRKKMKMGTNFTSVFRQKLPHALRKKNLLQETRFLYLYHITAILVQLKKKVMYCNDLKRPAMGELKLIEYQLNFLHFH